MVKRIKVRNFLSLKDVDLELRSLNVLVGPNMSGKSNLIECFKFLQEVVSRPQRNDVPSFQEAFSRRGGFGEVVWKGQAEGPIALELFAETPEACHYSISARRGEYGNPEVEGENLTVDLAGRGETILANGAGKFRVIRAGNPVEGPQNTLQTALGLYGGERSFRIQTLEFHYELALLSLGAGTDENSQPAEPGEPPRRARR
jgi:predicted ATPase